MKHPEKPKSHKIQLREMSVISPLARLSNSLGQSEESRRARFYARFLEGIHLGNTITAECSGQQALIDGRLVTNFGSPSYLGLERHPDVLAAAQSALVEWGNDAGCPRHLMSHENVIRLEEEIASLAGSEKALIGVNSTQVHQGAIPVLFGSPDAEIFLERSAPAGMEQASQIAKAQGAQVRIVDAASLLDLDNALRCSRAERKSFLVSSLSLAKGTVHRLRDMEDICTHRGAVLYVDDSHGIGVYGEEGGGLTEELGLSFDNMVLVGSLQEGCGAFGAFVAAVAPVIDFLRIRSTTYLHAGTLQPQAVEGSRAAIALVRSAEGHERRVRVKRISWEVRSRLQEMDFNVAAGDSPIVCIHVGGELKTLMAGRKLFDEGIYVQTLVPPVVARGQGTLRIALSSAHSEEDIETLLRSFQNLSTYWKEARGPLGQNLKYAREVLRTQVRARLKNLSVVRF